VGRTTAATSSATTPHSATQNPLTGSLGRRSSAASTGTATPSAATTATAASSDATVTPGNVLSI
jgi:hypothetical protein